MIPVEEGLGRASGLVAWVTIIFRTSAEGGNKSPIRLKTTEEKHSPSRESHGENELLFEY